MTRSPTQNSVFASTVDNPPSKWRLFRDKKVLVPGSQNDLTGYRPEIAMAQLPFFPPPQLSVHQDSHDMQNPAVFDSKVDNRVSKRRLFSNTKMFTPRLATNLKGYLPEFCMTPLPLPPLNAVAGDYTARDAQNPSKVFPAVKTPESKTRPPLNMRLVTQESEGVARTGSQRESTALFPRFPRPSSSSAGALRLTVMVSPMDGTETIPVAVNRRSKVRELRGELKKLAEQNKLTLPEEYFFIHRQRVMWDNESFISHGVEEGGHHRHILRLGLQRNPFIHRPLNVKEDPAKL